MHAVLKAYGRALLSQLHGKMLLLSFAPFLLAGALWAFLLWWGLQPLIDQLHATFVEYDGFKLSSSVLATVGLSMLTNIIVPLLAMLLVLPLMIVTALFLVGIAAMPAIVRHVGGRHFPLLEKKRGGGWFGSLLGACGALVGFALASIAALPLYVVPPLALLVHVLLWGWLSYRVLAYDALAEYASGAERRAIMQQQRWPLLLIGTVSGLAGAIPGIVWLGGTVLSVVLFPFLAALSIWLYVLIFIFTGLWFEYYCLAALSRWRAMQDSADA